MKQTLHIRAVAKAHALPSFVRDQRLLRVGLGGFAQAEQIKLWKEYIAWEKSNPQRLDGNTVAQRVSLAYEQALMPLMHCPEVSLAPLFWPQEG